MKKEYIAPELDVLRLRLSEDILGDSKWEDSDSEVGGGSSSLPPIDDDFS